MKRFKALPLLLLMLLPLSFILGFGYARRHESAAPSIIFSDDEITVCDVSGKPSPFAEVDREWALLGEDEVFDQRYSVIEGVVTSFSDVDVAYRSSNGEEAHSYETLMTVMVTQVIRDDTGIAAGDPVRVGIPYNSWTYDEALPRLSEGLEVVAFCYHCNDFKDDPETDWIQHCKYVDYWVYAPFELFLQKVDDSFLLYKPSYFADKIGSPLPPMVEPAGTEEDYDDWFTERMTEFSGTEYEAVLQALSDRSGRITSYALGMCRTVKEADLLRIIGTGFSEGTE